MALGTQNPVRLTRLDLLHAQDNPVSCRVAEKCGYLLHDLHPAARAVFSGDATATPKARTGPAGQLRALLVARRSAVKSRVQAEHSCAASSWSSTTRPEAASTGVVPSTSSPRART